jgi:mono/diheme cytochrome c family protein
VGARAVRRIVGCGAGLPLLAAALLSACTHDAHVLRSAVEPDAEAGRVTYLRACAPCHGADGRGDGPRAASLGATPADLTLLASRNGGVYTPDMVTDVVTGKRSVAAHRSGTMPVWTTAFGRDGSGAAAAASLSQQMRIAEVAAFVETLQRTPDE